MRRGAVWPLFLAVTNAYTLCAPSARRSCGERARCRPVCCDVTSPFESVVASSGAGQGPLALTYENVELVLEEMRPYLMADGGNVALREIDGATVSAA